MPNIPSAFPALYPSLFNLRCTDATSEPLLPLRNNLLDVALTIGVRANTTIAEIIIILSTRFFIFHPPLYIKLKHF